MLYGAGFDLICLRYVTFSNGCMQMDQVYSLMWHLRACTKDSFLDFEHVLVYNVLVCILALSIVLVVNRNWGVDLD